MEHWAKNVSKKLPQNTFKTRLDKLGTFFGRFLNFENFLKTFRRLDLPWNTGQKKFSKKVPQNMFKNTFGQFGNNFGRFLVFEYF